MKMEKRTNNSTDLAARTFATRLSSRAKTAV
jgi:hypothetical protein